MINHTFLYQVAITNSTQAACFDVSARPGTDFNILKDNALGLTVSGRSANDNNGEVRETNDWKQSTNVVLTLQMYFNQIRMQLGGETALISIQGGQLLQESKDKSLMPLDSNKVITRLLGKQDSNTQHQMITAGQWEIMKSGNKATIKFGLSIELVLTSSQSGTGLEVITYENGQDVTGLIGQFLTRKLKLSLDEKSIIDGDKTIPVTENSVDATSCFYTDDYTMKFLGRRYYDYIN